MPRVGRIVPVAVASCNKDLPDGARGRRVVGAVELRRRRRASASALAFSLAFALASAAHNRGLDTSSETVAGNGRPDSRAKTAAAAAASTTTTTTSSRQLAAGKHGVYPHLRRLPQLPTVRGQRLLQHLRPREAPSRAEEGRGPREEEEESQAAILVLDLVVV